MATKIRYSAIVLDDLSRTKLLSEVPIPEDWTVVAHHMTLCLGELPINEKRLIGTKVEMICTHSGFTDKAIAVKVGNVGRFMPGTPHITIAINEVIGGKAKDSNNIGQWTKMSKSLTLSGIIQEIE